MEKLTLTLVPTHGPVRWVTDTPEAIGAIGHDATDDRLIRHAFVDCGGERHWFKRNGRFTVAVTRTP